MTEEMKTIRFTAELKLPAEYVTKEHNDDSNWTLIDVVGDAVSSWIPNTYTALSVKEAEVKE
jgi:hypothetical protein